MNILLPIETINRELDYKLVLASYLSGKGHQIYIGQHDFLMNLVPYFKEGGLYIGKTVFTKKFMDKGERYFFLKKHKFNIIFLHEEGAVFNGKKNLIKILKKLYNINYFDKNDDLCVWGNVQKKVEKLRSKKVPIHVTGHPRFDLYKKEWNKLHELKINKLNKTYKDFVLVSGNYSVANSGLGIKNLFNEELRTNLLLRSNLMDTYSSSMKQMMSIIHMTYHLAIKFPNLNFIYRPHPSENHEYYKIIFKGIKNIFVIHEGPVLPWILASKFLIHDGCTTAIEAYLAKIPVINYKPYLDSNYDMWLPNQIGIRIKKIDNLISFIKSKNKKKSKLATRYKNKEILKYLYNFENNSYEKFLKVIDKRVNKKIQNNKITVFLIKFYYFKLRIKEFLYKILMPHKKIEFYYHKTKFYGFQQSYIIEKLKIISKILNKKISHKFHNSHLISIDDK